MMSWAWAAEGMSTAVDSASVNTPRSIFMEQPPSWFGRTVDESCSHRRVLG